MKDAVKKDLVARAMYRSIDMGTNVPAERIVRDINETVDLLERGELALLLKLTKRMLEAYEEEALRSGKEHDTLLALSSSLCLLGEIVGAHCLAEGATDQHSQ